MLIKTLKTEKKKDNLMTFIFVAMLGITIFSLYKAYKTLKNGLKKLKVVRKLTSIDK